MRVGRIGVAIAAVAVLASACGGVGNADPGSDGGTGASGTTGIEHPTGANDLILGVAYEGGFVAYEYTLGTTPFWSLFGDGTLIVPGPQIEIYPGPALPNLTATPVSEDGIQAILQAARDAGLMDGDKDYGDMCIADAANTVFTTTADGSTSVVTAYALDVGEPTGTCGGGKDAAARAKLAAFQAKLTDLASWLPAGSLGTEAPYDPDRDARLRPPVPRRSRAPAGPDRVAARHVARRVRRGGRERSVADAMRCGERRGPLDAARGGDRTRTRSPRGQAAGPSTT